MEIWIVKRPAPPALRPSYLRGRVGGRAGGRRTCQGSDYTSGTAEYSRDSWAGETSSGNHGFLAGESRLDGQVLHLREPHPRRDLSTDRVGDIRGQTGKVPGHQGFFFADISSFGGRPS
jgi:hypothetical protein